MPQVTATLDQVTELARRLSPVDKLRLIGRLAPDLESALGGGHVTPPGGRRGLKGLLTGSPISDEDIAAARREAWGRFDGEV